MKKRASTTLARKKVGILRRHPLDKVGPGFRSAKNWAATGGFYRWQKEFFENGAAAFHPERKSSATSNIARC
jgi:transposase